jgi:hypothetical protein
MSSDSAVAAVPVPPITYTIRPQVTAPEQLVVAGMPTREERWSDVNEAGPHATDVQPRCWS